jgi:hypothetical protein
VRFFSNTTGTEFFYKTGGRYRYLCTAPCVHDFASGIYVIGVRMERDEPIARTRQVLVDQPTSIVADVRVRHGVRAAGGLVLTLSGLMAAVTTVYLVAADDPATGPAVGMLVTGGIGTIVGLSLAFVDDGVAISVNQRP